MSQDKDPWDLWGRLPRWVRITLDLGVVFLVLRWIFG